MGPFSSKTKINVFSNAIPLIEEDHNSIAEIIVSAVLTGNDIAEGIISGALAGQSRWTDRMLNYAKSDYTLGLAGGVRHTTTTLDEGTTQTAITTDLALPYGCLVEYSFITELTIDFVTLPFLINQRNYDQATNLIKVYPPGLDLEDTYVDGAKTYPLIHKVIVDAVTFSDDELDAIIDYSIVSTYITIDESYDENYNTIFTRTIVNLPTTYFQENYTINPGMRIGRPYCIAKYWELDSGFQKIEANNWWYYDVTTEVYPTIDNDYEFDEQNHFFPVVPIRYNNVDYTAEAKQETDLYKTSKILLNRAGLDIQDIGGAINDNPDVDEIDHAYVMWGINLQSDNKESIRYLVEFFDYLYDEAVVSQSGFTNFQLGDEVIKQRTFGFNSQALVAPSGTTTKTTYDDYDYDTVSYQVTTVNTTKAASLTEQGLDTSVTFSYISSNFVNGSIGPKGTVTKSYAASTGGSRPGSFRLLGATDNSVLILRHQETVGAYKEIKIVGLVHTNRIYDGHSVHTTVADVFGDPEEDNFVIPIHYGVSKRLPLTVRNELYLQAIHIIINGYVKTKVRWYERSFFKLFLKVVAIVVAVWFQQWWALAAMAAMEILVRIASPAFLVAIKVLYIAYTLYTLNVGAAVSTMTTAVRLLKNVSALVDLAQVPQQIKLLNIAEEMQDLAVEREAATKELEEIQNQLDTSSFLNPGLLLDNPTLSSHSNESPTAFYLRTLQNNAGLLSLDIVENYHTALLALPEPDYDTAFGINQT